MEAHQQQQHQVHPNDDDEEGGNKMNSSFVCRQSSTRWSPTTEQIRILKELYYNNGVRSPSADQIQRISARLRQYGKIEGKNVFYWFQNHKARERQKKRFTTTTDHHHHHMNIINIPTMQQQRGSSGWRSDHQVQDPLYNNNYPNIITSTTPSGVPSPSSSSSSSSPSVIGVGQMGGYGYGSATMERTFRDCSISRGGCGGGSIGHSFGWVGVDSYSKPYPFLDQRKSVDQTLEEEQEDQPPQIETLSLFPMHRTGDIKPESDAYHNATSWYISDDGKGSSRSTSLELSLNSYTGS